MNLAWWLFLALDSGELRIEALPQWLRLDPVVE